MSLDDHYVSIDRRLDSHLGQHPDDRLRSVALLVGEASHTGKTACALTECSEDRNDREEVRTVGCIYAESLQRSTLDSDVSPVSVKLRKAGSRVHEYVHDREVCLKGSRVKSLNLKLSEDRAGHKEVGSSAPVSLKIDICSSIFLTALHLEDHFGT